MPGESTPVSGAPGICTFHKVHLLRGLLVYIPVLLNQCLQGWAHKTVCEKYRDRWPVG
jgi:hypothetical protein